MLAAAAFGFAPAAPSGCNFSPTGMTDLTTACTPAFTAGGCLFFDKTCQLRKELNTAVLSEALSLAPPGSTLRVPPGTYHLNAGVYAPLVNATTLQLEGTLDFGGAAHQTNKSVRDHWPGFNESDPDSSHACNCFTIKRFIDFKLVSPPGTRGIIDGGGKAWCGRPRTHTHAHTQTHTRTHTHTHTHTHTRDTLEADESGATTSRIAFSSAKVLSRLVCLPCEFEKMTRIQLTCRSSRYDTYPFLLYVFSLCAFRPLVAC